MVIRRWWGIDGRKATGLKGKVGMVGFPGQMVHDHYRLKERSKKYEYTVFEAVSKRM